MPKSNNLTKLFELLKEQNNPSNADHFLFLLGTDTVFTPKPTIDLAVEPAAKKTYERGETLSYTAQLLASVLGEETTRENSEEPLSFYSDSVQVLNGPTTLGSEVGERIAQAVLLALRAAANGKTNILITAHSRGAVEAILVMNELERIKKALNEAADKSLFTILCDSPCTYTKAAFLKSAATAEDDSKDNRQNLLQRLEKLRLNAFLIDPVPGGRYYGLPGIAWRDQRFYQPSPCKENYELILYRDERTRCFIPVVPDVMQATVLPGHHGTGSGNLYNQQFIEKQPGTEAVQDLLLCKLLYFFKQKSGVFSKDVATVSLEHNELDAVANAFFQASTDDKKRSELLNRYTIVQEYDKHNHYRKFSEGSYAYLGREYARDNQRLVHFREHNYVSMAEVAPVVQAGFVNIEHVKLFLQDYIVFRKGAPVIEWINEITMALANIIREMGGKTCSDLTTLIRDKDGSVLFFNALSVLVDDIGQKYLRNHLSAEEKSDLRLMIKKPFDTIKNTNELKNNDDKAIFVNCGDILQKGLKRTIETHCSSIIGQIDQLIAHIDCVAHPEKLHQELQKIIGSTSSGDEGVQGALDSLKDSLVTLGAGDSVEEIRLKLEQQLGQINEKTDLSIEQKQEISAKLFSGHKRISVYFEAHDTSLEQYLKKIQDLYTSASGLKQAYPEIAELLEDNKAEIPFKEINYRRQGLICAGGKLLVTKKYDLSVKPEYLSEEFFDLLKRQAIAMGAVSPEQLALERENGRLQTQLEKEVATLTDKNDELQAHAQRLTDENGQLKARVQIIDANAEALEGQVGEIRQHTEAMLFALEKNEDLIQRLNSKDEQDCAYIINHRLLPVAENYHKHLWREAAKYHSGLDPVCGNSLPGTRDVPFDNESAKASYDSIHRKFEAVQDLITVLKDSEQPLPSERLKSFSDKLTDYENSLKSHRDKAWKRYSKTCFSVLGIIATGVIPGLVGLAIYSKVKHEKSPLFFNHTSRGEQFAEDCKTNLNIMG